jgi:hypothetical protein
MQCARHTRGGKDCPESEAVKGKNLSPSASTAWSLGHLAGPQALDGALRALAADAPPLHGVPWAG